MLPCAPQLHTPPGLAARLRRLNRHIENAIQGPTLSAECRQTVRGGKHLRAKLVFASARGSISHPTWRHLLDVAAALELAHAASLLHDDVVDASETRRGFPALHAALGTRTAVLSGAYIFDVGLRLIAALPHDVRTRLAETAREMAKGQFEEIVRSRDTTVTVDDRIVIMRRKTASLFALSCELGGVLSDMDAEACARRKQLGDALGMLFQITDDTEDLFGNPTQLGRAPGADLDAGVVSLLFAVGLEGDRRADMAAMLARRSGDGPEERVQRCRTLLLEAGALTEVERLAARYARSARSGLRALPPSWGTRWMASLVDVLEARITDHRTSGCSREPAAYVGNESTDA